MHIYQYSRTFWYPSGTLASGIPVRVFPLDSPVLATLWADQAGTIPLANPVTTNGSGVATFYAEEGEYWLHADAESFRVSVGSPDLDLPEVVSGYMSTGLVAGGAINVSGSNPAAVDIEDFTGYVVDNVTDPDNPAVIRLHSDGFTAVPLIGASLTRIFTWWLVDSTGALIQQATRPTNTQRRTHIALGVTAYDSVSGAIIADQTLPVIAAQTGNQLADLMDSMRPFVTDGCVITPNGANLSLALSSGSVFARAFNYLSGPTLTRDPHISAIPAQPLVSLRRIFQTPQFPLPAPVTTLNVAQYESAPGVLTNITGNDASVQRVWLFPANNAADQVVVQYGQHLYADLNSALDAIGSGIYVPNPTTNQSAVLLAWVIAAGNATALNNPAQCIIKRAQPMNFP